MTGSETDPRLDRRRFMLLSSIGLGALGLPVMVTPARRTAAAASGGRVIYGYGAEAVKLDPGDAIDRPSFDVMQNIYDGLVELDQQGAIQPALATEWSISDDNLTWTFTLRDDVTFHDGTDFNADAVKVNLDRILDESNKLGTFGQWDPVVAAVNVTGPLEVQVVTKLPAGGLLNLMASGYGGIVSPAAIEQFGADLGRNPVGTGPFVFSEWEQGQRIVLTKNANYWGGAPAIDELEFRVIQEDGSRILALEAGDVDVIANVSAQNIPVLRDNSGLVVIQQPTYRLFYWAFNCTKDVFKDVRVRQAFNYLIDRESLVENVLQGVGQPADAPIPPTVVGYAPIGTYTYDPEKGKALLAEAGFPADWEGVAYLTEGRYYMDRQVGEAIQGMLADAGVNVRVEVLEWGAFIDAVWVATADSEAAQARDFAQTAFGTADPGQTFRSTLFSTYWPTTGYNEALFADPNVDAAIEAVEQAVAEEERVAAIQTLSQAIFAAAPWIFSHFEQQVVGHTATLEGIEVLPTEIIRFRGARRTG
ncbi:MAG: ABC transporter substrate-binding protein [Thermomicrobiales bacterium]